MPVDRRYLTSRAPRGTPHRGAPHQPRLRGLQKTRQPNSPLFGVGVRATADEVRTLNRLPGDRCAGVVLAPRLTSGGRQPNLPPHRTPASRAWATSHMG